LGRQLVTKTLALAGGHTLCAMPRRFTVLTGIFPPDIGGPATSVPDLVGQLAQEGREVAVVTLADGAGTADPDPCPIVRIPRSMARPRRAREVIRAVHQTKPDVVLANGLHVEAALVLRVPIVQKIVGDWAWERSQNNGWSALDVERFQHERIPPRARAVRILRTAVTRRSRLVIVPSRYVAGLVNRWGISEERIRIVPNAAPALTLSRSPRRPRALFAGRLVRWKHLDHVLRVLPKLPALGFDIVGTGPELAELQRLSRSLGLEHCVVFHGALPREAVLEKMQESACLVLPSSYEGMPHVVLEAFSARLPVVASDAGGIPELIEDGVSGLLYPWGRLDALAEALQTATDPGIASRLSEEGVAVARRLSLDATVAATKRVLDEAVG
jgi:glycosyltransferase involved in cell wall biosynthesis